MSNAARHVWRQIENVTAEPRAHTSLLLGNVRNGKIDQLLNIDGFSITVNLIKHLGTPQLFFSIYKA